MLNEMEIKTIKEISVLLTNEIGITPKHSMGSNYDYLYKHDRFYITVNDFAIALVTKKHNFWAFSEYSARQILKKNRPDILLKIDNILTECKKD